MHNHLDVLNWRDVLIGVSLGLLSSLFGEGANMLLKKYTAKHLANSKLPYCDSFLIIYSISAVFAAGLAVASLRFLSISIYNCGTGLNVPLVATMSWLLLKEKINRYQIYCIILLFGAIIAVALTSDKSKPRNMMDQLGNVMNASYNPVVFISIVGAFEMIGAVFLWKRYRFIAQLNKDVELRRNTFLISTSSAEESDSLSITSPVYYARVITKIPGETYFERVISIFGFSCLSAMQLFWVVICADILLNQVERFLLGKPVVMLGWIFFPLSLFCSGLFFCFMQMTLACFRAIDVLPIYVAFQNIANGIGSIAMLGSTPDKPFGYVICLTLAFTFGLLYTALIDENKFFAYIPGLPCSQKLKHIVLMASNTPVTMENNEELVVKSDAIDIIEAIEPTDFVSDLSIEDCKNF